MPGKTIFVLSPTEKNWCDTLALVAILGFVFWKVAYVWEHRKHLRGKCPGPYEIEKQLQSGCTEVIVEIYVTKRGSRLMYV